MRDETLNNPWWRWWRTDAALLGERTRQPPLASCSTLNGCDSLRRRSESIAEVIRTAEEPVFLEDNTSQRRLCGIVVRSARQGVKRTPKQSVLGGEALGSQGWITAGSDPNFDWRYARPCICSAGSCLTGDRPGTTREFPHSHHTSPSSGLLPAVACPSALPIAPST